MTFCSFPSIFPTLCILSYSKSYSWLVISRSRITFFTNSFRKLSVVSFFLTGIPETVKQFLREYWWSRSISPLSLATLLHNRELVFVATVSAESRFSTFPSSVQTFFSSFVIWFFRASITDISWLFSSCCLDDDDAVPLGFATFWHFGGIDWF